MAGIARRSLARNCEVCADLRRRKSPKMTVREWKCAALRAMNCWPTSKYELMTMLEAEWSMLADSPDGAAVAEECQ